MTRFRFVAPLAALSVTAGAALAQGQPEPAPAAPGEGADLAKKLSNPVSDLGPTWKLRGAITLLLPRKK